MTADRAPRRAGATGAIGSPAPADTTPAGTADRGATARRRSLRRAAAALGVILLVVPAVLSSCTSDLTSAAGALTPANADLVSLRGVQATTTAVEDGRIELRLTTNDRFVVYRRVDDGEIQADTHTLTDLDAVWEAAGFTAVAPRMTIDLRRHDGDFSMSALSVPTVDDGVITLTGFPVGGLPPQRFEDWAMFVVPSTDDTTPAATPVGGGAPSLNPAVIELTVEDYLAAMTAAPLPPSVATTSIGSTPVGTRPSDFEVRTTLLLPVGATYDLDVNAPGSTDARRLTARLVVDEDEVALTDESDPGALRITDPGSAAGARTVTIAAGPFDVGSVTAVTTQVRVFEPAGAPRPWEDVLPCRPGVDSFDWRVPGESLIRHATCPTPFTWVSSAPISPSLQPDAVAVADAAGFDTPAALETHIGHLLTAVVGTPDRDRGLVVQLQVAMLVPTSETGLPVTIPILLVQVDPAAAGEVAAEVASEIRLFEQHEHPVGDVDLSFSATLTSSAAPGVLSSVRDVVLPAASVTG